RERPRGGRAAECDQQFPPSDGDCHTPLPCEVRKGTVPRHERPVFTFKEGRMLVASTSLVSFNCTTPAASFSNAAIAAWRVAVAMRWRAVVGLREGEDPRHGLPTGAAAVIHHARATTAVRASYSGVNRSSTCKLHQTK